MLVAVYGTLKRGHGNYNRILRGRSEFIGTTQLDNFTMVSLGGFPGLIPDNILEKPSEDYKVEIEVFNVEEDVLRTCDMLEGYPGWYNRVTVPTEFGEAFIYIFDKGEYSDRPIVESGKWN